LERKTLLRIPLTLTLTLGAGILIGASFFGNPSSGDEVARSSARIQEVLHYIRHDYVDTVPHEQLTANAIDGMLERLDPHSSYVPAQNLTIANAGLEEDFEGVGVEFILLRDTIQVITPVSGGPAAKAGMLAGDRIVGVNGQQVASTHISTSQVFTLLRGPSGSRVKLSVVRPGTLVPLAINVRRGRIPTRSVDAFLMHDALTGYIKISRFSAGTDKEFRAALGSLRKQGLHRLVLDLRDNPGGYLDKAIRIADEFLPEGRSIVYTKGKLPKYNANYKATKNGQFEVEPIVVLLNEGSASAAEILAGALQDNDRATIVGRRSFGKGLVQLPITLSDGAELRLTISRYFTPSGRCIQKPYTEGGLDEYNEDLDDRYRHGELFSEDSIRNADTIPYHTRSGRLVFGGGGIRPDVFVRYDSSSITALLARIQGSYVLTSAALAMSKEYKRTWIKAGSAQYRKRAFPTITQVEYAIQLARREGIKLSILQLQVAKPGIANSLKAANARLLFGEAQARAIALDSDPEFLRAVASFPSRIAAR
jgi:carboxyl-terminal processing protease